MFKIKAIKAIALMVSALFLLNTNFVYAETDRREDDRENLYAAKSVVLAEAATGQILYSQNPNEKLAIASVTKIMTLLLAAEEMKAGKLSMEDTITASYNAFITDGSVIWLNEGEKMSVYDITRSIVISSANDACVALAEHLGSSEENFVKLMNKKAKDLGMNNTLFANCTGLDAENQYSTAADVAIMAAELRKYDYYDEFLLTRLSYVREGTDRATQLLNTNRLLEYNGITGLKTGTTDNAGYCFTATAERNGMELVAVVLGAKTDDGRFDIAEELLDYGFNGFELFSPQFDTEQLADIKVKNGVAKIISVEPEQGLQCLIPKGKSKDVTYLYNIRKEVNAPVQSGDQVGKIVVLLGNDTLFVVPVTSENSSEKLTFLKSFWYIFKGLVSF